MPEGAWDSLHGGSRKWFPEQHGRSRWLGIGRERPPPHQLTPRPESELGPGGWLGLPKPTSRPEWQSSKKLRGDVRHVVVVLHRRNSPHVPPGMAHRAGDPSVRLDRPARSGGGGPARRRSRRGEPAAAASSRMEIFSARAKTSAQLRFRSVCSRRHAARDTRARPPSRRQAAILPVIVTLTRRPCRRCSATGRPKAARRAV